MSTTLPGTGEREATARFVPRSGETWRDPFAMYAGLRDLDPVHHVEAGDYWVLSRYDDVFAAARDAGTFSSASGLTFAYDDMDHAGLADAAPLVMLDPPEHTEFRRLVSSGFTPRRVADIEDAVRRFVVERIERLRSAGETDIVAELFRPLPSFVVAHYLGVPDADRDQFEGWTRAIVAANASGGPLATSDAVGELFEYFAALVERRRMDPGDDTISMLVASSDDAGSASILQVLGFAFTMVAGGNDTATGMLGGALELLCAHRGQRETLRSEPGLVADAVEEILRLTSPVQGLARTTTCEVDVAGRTIPEGRRVLLLYASANRDPRRFGDDAADFRVDRCPRQIMTFSSGHHYCLGAATARLQGRVVLEELLARCPDFSVDAAAGTFAPGSFVRRYQSLPFVAAGPG